MSHGGRDAADDFGRAASKLAVAQICETAGFHGIKESALEAFADVAVRYLFDLGKMAEFYANSAGRSQCSVFDVIRGLEDLQATQGFPGAGASEADRCLASSGTVRELVHYVDSAEDVPFARPIPRFPVIKDRRRTTAIPSFMEMGETPPSNHIPAWLPAFPDPHTYVHTPVWNERATHPREDKIEHARQRRRAERSLLSLQQRLLCNGSVGSGTSTSIDQERVENENNPFLRNPVPPGNNKHVSSVALPSKLSVENETVDGGANRVSVFEAFAPAIEALKGGSLPEDGKEGEKVLPAVRPSVHFKFRAGKKLTGESLDTRPRQKKDILLGTASLGGREEERDDKKRRAEYILEQSYGESTGTHPVVD